jgi:hemerythrin-like domain-containing protein
MRLIVYYLRHYSDRLHHPREDVAFTRIERMSRVADLARGQEDAWNAAPLIRVRIDS